jgi:putative acetyltransferase
MIIVPGDFENLQLLALLRLHLGGMHANSPPGSVNAFDLSGLKAPDVSVYTAWRDDKLLGMAALKQLDAATGEIKSMRTDPAHLREGVAKALLDHILSVGKARGYRRLSLETGSGKAFEPALSLYRKNGFINGQAFGGYEVTSFNQFLHLDLVREDSSGA